MNPERHSKWLRLLLSRRHGRALFRVALIVLLAVVSGTAGAWFALHMIYRSDLPDPESIQTIRPALRSSVYSVDGQVLYTFFRENRVLVPLSEIPPHLVDAVVSIEDRKFREHWGVDLLGVTRALMSNVRHRRLAQGASTITQQLARDLFLTREKTLSRKIREFLLALKLEQTYSKDEILELYLNQIYFGEGAYGVEAAARVFFDKHAKDLSLPEAALLAGLPRNPSGYSPENHPDVALERRNLVLEAMRETGAITRQEYHEAREAPLELAEKKPYARVGSYFVQYVKQILEETYGAERIYQDGLRIYTTLDTRLQTIAERALEANLQELEARAGYAVQRNVRWFARKSGTAGPTPYLQGALLALDAQDGSIRAMVGGRSFEESYFNRAVQAYRQPGSAFKVFIYTTAIQHGYTPASILLDTPLVIPDMGGQDWAPQNYDEEFLGPITLRYAVQKSINIPAVRVLLDVGIDNVIATARSMGIHGTLPPYPSLALGSGEVSLFELTSAYQAIANQGIRAGPLAILEVQDRFGLTLEKQRSRKEEVLDAPTAYVMTSLLESALDHGTGQAARTRGFTPPAAGKTGTTNDFSDAWYIGFTPHLVCGVWVGFDTKKTLGNRKSGAVVALPIWTDFMIGAVEGMPPDEFPIPDGIVTRDVCAASGELPGPRCPEVHSEVFVSGTEPTVFCRIHAPELRGSIRDEED